MTRHGRRRARDYAVYLAVRVVVCVLQSLSLEAAYRAAFILGRLAYWLDKRHRGVALANLAIAYPEWSAAERGKTVRAVYDHFARVLVEVLFIPRKLRPHNWKKFIRTEVDPAAMDLFLQKRPVIIVTGHLGNWEMAGYLIAAMGLKPTTIARDLDNPYLHQFLLRLRSWSGQKIISKKGDYAAIEKTLAEGQTLVAVADQNAGPRAHFVPFFGKLASTHKAISLLAAEYNAPIFVGSSYRLGNGFHYKVTAQAPIEPKDFADANDPAFELTKTFTRELEEAIRLAPEQYFWLHRRWKEDPPKRAQNKAA